MARLVRGHHEAGLSLLASLGRAAGLENSEQQQCTKGPRTTYLPQQSITIGGCRFTCSSTGRLDAPVQVRDSIIMRGILTERDIIYFGILREVWLTRTPDDVRSPSTPEELWDCYDTPVLVVDWISVPITPAGRLHPVLRMPVLEAGLMSAAAVARTFSSARFCNPQDVIPTTVILAPWVPPTMASFRSGAGLQHTKLVVLHRDPELRKLALFDRGWRSW
jgi:hypothetical protein